MAHARLVCRVLQFSTPIQLTDTDVDLQTGLHPVPLSREAGQTALEKDIMKADGSYFIPVASVDSGSLETETMTPTTASSNSDTAIEDTSDSFTEASFSLDSETRRGFSKSTQEEPKEDRTSTPESLQQADMPELQKLVQMLHQEANGVSSVDRKLFSSPGMSCRWQSLLEYSAYTRQGLNVVELASYNAETGSLKISIVPCKLVDLVGLG